MDDIMRECQERKLDQTDETKVTRQRVQQLWADASTAINTPSPWSDVTLAGNKAISEMRDIILKLTERDE